MELSIAYAIETAGGARVVVGNSDLARADTDWIGYLDPDQGITGLLDGPDIRTSSQVRPVADGAQIGPGWRAMRSGTIQGMLDPNSTTATREAYADRLRLVMHDCVRQDATLRWTPSGDGIERELAVRCAARPDIRGRQPTTFMVTLTSPDVTIGSSEVQEVVLEPGGGVETLAMTNLGTVAAWPTFDVRGPLSSLALGHAGGDPPLVNIIPPDGTLPGGLRYMIYAERRLVLLQEVDVLDPITVVQNEAVHPASEWWQVPAGVSVASASAAGDTTDTRITVRWRHTWP